MGEGGDSCQLLPKWRLKNHPEIHYPPLTGRFVPRFGRRRGLPHSSRGIGLLSIQGDGPKAVWVLWSYNTGSSEWAKIRKDEEEWQAVALERQHRSHRPKLHRVQGKKMNNVVGG